MSKKLLLADDSVTIQKVVGITFANEDVEILTETSGAAALERIRSGAPDVVLADVSMPEMTGYELCAAIKADPSIAHVPVILLTGTFEPYDEDRTRESGADGHIAKPFEAQALVDLVHTTLNREAAAPQVAASPEPRAPLAEPVAAPLPDLAPIVTPELPDLSEQSTVLQPLPNIEPPAPSAVSGEAVRTLDPQPDLLTPSSTGDRAGSAPPADLDGSDGETVFHQTPPAVTPRAPAPEIDPSGQETILDSVVPSAPSVPELPSIDPFGLETVVANPPAPIADPVDPVDPADRVEPAATIDPMDISGPSTEQPTQFLDPNAPGPLTPPSRGRGPDSEPSLSTDSDIFGAPLVDQEPEPEPGVLAAEEALEAIEAMPTDSVQGLPSPEAFDFNEPTATASAAAVATQSIIDADTNVPELELAPIEEAPIDAAPLEDELDETDPSPFTSNPLADTQPETETETNGASDAAFATSRDAGQLDPAGAAASDLINPEDVRAALEKVAWDAFGSISEQVVREVVTKLEAVAWEVVPALAERLIKEEIQRLKNGNSSS